MNADRSSVRARSLRLRTLCTLEREVDRVADHRVLGARGHQVRGVVVAEHRQGDDHGSREDPLLRQRQRDPPERARGARAHVAGRLELGPIDPIECGVEGQDEERDVAVDQPEDHRHVGDGSAVPHDRLVHEGAQEEEPVEQAGIVRLHRQQVHPGEHPHQVAHPERRDHQGEQEDLHPPAVARDVVGDRIADQRAEHDRRGDVQQGACELRLDPPGREQLARGLGERLELPLQRVPRRDRQGEDLITGAERDRRDRVERHDEQEQQPDDPGRRERRVVPASLPDGSARRSGHPWEVILP